MSNALTLSTAAKNAAINAVTALVDAGTPPGNLVIKSAGGTVLASLAMSATAFAAASSGAAAANAIADDASANATGTAATFEVQNAAGTVIFSGTCGLSGEGLNLSSLSIVATKSVSVTSLTVTLA